MEIKDLAQEKYISLTTFKRDGTPVSTPVWVTGDDGKLLVWSAVDSWKVKRIRRDPHVRVAASSGTGKVHGEALDATAEIVGDTAHVQELLARKYGLLYRSVRLLTATLRFLRRRPASKSVTLAITPR